MSLTLAYGSAFIKQVVIVALGLTCLLAPRAREAQARDKLLSPPPTQGVGGPRILAQNRYYAKPGKADEVFAWRQHASDVLRKLGLQTGMVFRGAGGDEPDAIFQIVLDSATLVREGRIALESPDFQQVMRHMGTLVRRFESATYLQRRLQVTPDTTSRLQER